MVTTFGFKNGRLEPSEDGKVIAYTAPDRDEIDFLATKYGIERHNLASALDPDELGRMERVKDHWTFIMKTPCNYTSEDQLLFTVTSMGLFLFKDKLLVVSTEPFDVNDYRQVRQVKNVKDAFLSILYGSTAHFNAHIKVITMLSDSLEKRINTSMENHFLLNMFTLEKSLVFFVNGIGSNEVVMETIRENAGKIRFTEEQVEILNDIVIENKQCEKQAEIYSNILTGLMDARGSVVNNNLSVLIKRLTIVSVVFMPLNLLASMGGMSEFSSWTHAVPWWVAYPAFLLALSGLGFGIYRYLMRTTSGTNLPAKGKA